MTFDVTFTVWDRGAKAPRDITVTATGDTQEEAVKNATHNLLTNCDPDTIEVKRVHSYYQPPRFAYPVRG